MAVTQTPHGAATEKLANDAMSGAIDFLLARQDDHGWWHDFGIAGDSDAWITGYTATALASTRRPDALRAAIDGWCAVRRRTWFAAGWGYNEHVPRDADSTAWALRAAQQLDVRFSLRSQRALRLLSTHRQSDGGIATYRNESEIKQFTGLDASFRGWCSSHTCVSAVVAGIVDLPERGRTLDYLRQHQRPDGRWSSYWWAHDAVATAFASETLESTGRADDRDCVRRAAAWAATTVGDDGSVPGHNSPNGSPFVTALIASTAARSDEPSTRAASRRAADWVLAAQRPDGSWEPSACLRVPPPDLVDPDERRTWGTGGKGESSIGNVVRDTGVHTTATVVRALTPT